MSVYKKEEPAWFDVALESVLYNQYLVPDQMVLVCDGPLTDELNSVIDLWASRFKGDFVVHRLAKNHGLGFCLNEGLRLCKYDLVARMDSDDISVPARFNEQVRFLLDHQEIDILGGFASYIDESGAELGVRQLPVYPHEIHDLLWTCPLVHPSVMFRKSAIQHAGSYSSTLKRRQDYELWFRCAKNGAQFQNLPLPLIKYRVTSFSSKKNSLKVAWTQALIGFKGCRALSLSYRAHVGVFFPVLKALLPASVRKLVDRVFKRFDPREFA